MIILLQFVEYVNISFLWHLHMNFKKNLRLLIECMDVNLIEIDGMANYLLILILHGIEINLLCRET